MARVDNPYTFVDLFSGAGGMSYGFHAHPAFRVVGAADAQIGKPSAKRGSLGCNETYQLNIGVMPIEVDLGVVDPAELRDGLGLDGSVDVLSACPPCTGFSRTLAHNHVVDDHRNSLVRRVAQFAEALRPRVIVMENARELLAGNFGHHFEALANDLEDLGYTVRAGNHMLTSFGLPQVRERAVVVAVGPKLQARAIEDLWDGLSIRDDAITVRRAIARLPPIFAGQRHPDDAHHVSPRFSSELTRGRTAAIPRDGGSWRDLVGTKRLETYLTPAMQRLIAKRKLGSHPDVYGRLSWDRPAATIKRECGHVGNGRYTHPEQDRLLSLREMAILNGFPKTFHFGGTSLANMYRHVGDAVPPLISYQLAAVCDWVLTDRRPAIAEFLLPDAHLSVRDVAEAQQASAA